MYARLRYCFFLLSSHTPFLYTPYILHFSSLNLSLPFTTLSISFIISFSYRSPCTFLYARVPIEWLLSILPCMVWGDSCTEIEVVVNVMKV